MRPETPLAVENGVGKPAAPEAPNVGTGKRAWRTPIPDSVPVPSKGGAGTFCLPLAGGDTAQFEYSVVVHLS